MNANAKRNRRKMQKALHSMPTHPHPAPLGLKLSTEQAQSRRDSTERPHLLTIGETRERADDVLRAARKFYRYRPNEAEKEAQLGKYKSVDISGRGFKRSTKRLSLERSLESKPFRLLREKKSSHNFQAAESLAERLSVVSRGGNRESRKSSLNKRGSLSGPKIRQPSMERYKAAEGAEVLREEGMLCFKKGRYREALRYLTQAGEGREQDVELVDLKGVCLVSLKRYSQAIPVFNQLVSLDPHYNKKAYVYLALCENHLDRAHLCMAHIDKCIEMFPHYYEGHYFKGKLLFRQGLHQQALAFIGRANALHPTKVDIALLLGECYEALGLVTQAMGVYAEVVGRVDRKNAKHAVKYSRMLMEVGREAEAMEVLQRCADYLDRQSSQQQEGSEVGTEVSYLMSWAHFRQGRLDMACMKGEEVLKAGGGAWAHPTMRIMLAVKIRERDFYGASYLIERLGYLQLRAEELSEFVDFCEGVVLLMKKKTPEGLIRLLGVDEHFEGEKKPANEFNVHIRQSYRLYLVYAYFLLGEMHETMMQIQAQRHCSNSPENEAVLNYTQLVCEGILACRLSEHQKAEGKFREALGVYPDKPETHLYLAVVYFKLYFEQLSSDSRRELRDKIATSLNLSAGAFQEASHNYAAYALYYRGLFYCWQGEWGRAAQDLDLAIDKAEDNYLSFFYARAVAMANLHNYKQAINDASLALSIDEEDPDCYVLRARCLQIEGEANQAFADLQAFIDDKHIHTFAGHLLFENGAFEDALQAYNQEPIPPGDTEAFLTRGKTYFLLGRFEEASEDMARAWGRSGGQEEYQFDGDMMSWMSQMFQQQRLEEGREDQYDFSESHLLTQLQLLEGLYRRGEKTRQYGKVFKVTEYLTFRTVCEFFLGRYGASVECLFEAVELKKMSLEGGEEAEGDFEEEDADKLIFMNQMHYNMAIAYCMQRDYPSAERSLRKCQISKELHNYEVYMELLAQISGERAVEEGQDYLELFSLKNKISRYLPKVRVPFVSQGQAHPAYRLMKLCIPYPKVEPPDITPRFNESTLTRIDISAIERKPEAPWIAKERNSIRFTDRVEVFSRFEMERSEADRETVKHYPKGMAEDSLSELHFDADLRRQLQLSSEVEVRLQKLMVRDG